MLRHTSQSRVPASSAASSGDAPTRANTPSGTRDVIDVLDSPPRDVIDVPDSPPISSFGSLGRRTFVQASTSAADASSSLASAPAVARPPPAVNGQLLSGGTSNADDILVVCCGNCEARNVVETSKDAYYVVFKGKGAVGVHRSIDTTVPFVRGVPHAHAKRYTTRREAFEALAQAEASGSVDFL